MEHIKIINEILSDLDLDKIYSFYNTFGDTSDPEYYKKIPTYIQYPEEWRNKSLTVDLIKSSLSDAIEEALRQNDETTCRWLMYGFSYISNRFLHMVVWSPTEELSGTAFK